MDENMEFAHYPSNLLLALRLLHLLAAAAAATFKSRTALLVENLALRRQLAVCACPES